MKEEEPRVQKVFGRMGFRRACQLGIKGTGSGLVPPGDWFLESTAGTPQQVIGPGTRRA